MAEKMVVFCCRCVFVFLLLQEIAANKLINPSHTLDLNISKFEGLSFHGCLVHSIKTDLTYWDTIDSMYPDYTCPDGHFFRKSTSKLLKYRKFLVQGTLQGKDWSRYGSIPLTRFDTIKKAFGDLEQLNNNNNVGSGVSGGGKTVVELGDTSGGSFTHDGILNGYGSTNRKYWHPARIQDWDWTHGMFSVVAADCLSHFKDISISTVTSLPDSLARSTLMTQEHSFVHHILSESLLYLNTYEGNKIDLLYLTTSSSSSLSPLSSSLSVEPAAELQLRQVQLIVEKNVISDTGFILVDDVLSQQFVYPKNRDTTTAPSTWFGAGKYSIPYLLSHGFALEMNGYQVLLKKMSTFNIQPKALSASPFRVLHVGFHSGTQLELVYIAKELGFVLEFQYVEDPVPNKSNLKYNMNYARADRIWNANVNYYSTFDLIIVSDTSAIARIFLQNHWPGKLIVWICNRFDYAHGSKEATIENKDFPYPDHEFFNLIRSVGSHWQGKGKVVAGYTEFENVYARKYRNVEVGNLVLKPTGFGAALIAPTTSQIPKSIQKSSSFFLPPYENDKVIPAICKQLEISCYHGRYSGAMDLVGFKAVLHIPYAWSNLALFEIWRVGLVYVIPSQAFLVTMENIFWSPPYDKELLHLSEWYHPDNKDLFVYFNSWQELKEIYQWNDDAFMAFKKRIAIAVEERRVSTLSAWKNVMYRL